MARMDLEGRSGHTRAIGTDDGHKRMKKRTDDLLAAVALEVVKLDAQHRLLHGDAPPLKAQMCES